MKKNGKPSSSTQIKSTEDVPPSNTNVANKTPVNINVENHNNTTKNISQIGKVEDVKENEIAPKNQFKNADSLQFTSGPESNNIPAPYQSFIFPTDVDDSEILLQSKNVSIKISKPTSI